MRSSLRGGRLVRSISRATARMVTDPSIWRVAMGLVREGRRDHLSRIDEKAPDARSSASASQGQAR